jgi:hypothetical protein
MNFCNLTLTTGAADPLSTGKPPIQTHAYYDAQWIKINRSIHLIVKAGSDFLPATSACWRVL